MVKVKSALDLFLGGRVEPIQDRHLSDRSLLRFMYPKAGDDRTGEIGTGTIITLPFFENISITESQTPRWSKHDLLGRNGQLFTFTGAQSRVINLSFTMTLPHIKESNPHPAARYVHGEDSQAAKAAIRKSMKNSLKIGQDKVESSPDIAPWDPQMDGHTSEVESVMVDNFDKPAYIRNKEKHATAITAWWVNVIRTSTLNNGKDPRLGPPVIMLKHGPLYKDAKFICQKYDISFDENAGYDSSLLSRRIQVTMDLAEVKFGSGYKPGRDSATADALTGWQDLFEYGNLDPNNDTVPSLARHTNKQPENKDSHGQSLLNSTWDESFHRFDHSKPGWQGSWDRGNFV